MKHQVIGVKGIKTRKMNRRRAIRHHCLMCSDFNWDEVFQCLYVDCLLYDFRLGRLDEKELTPEDRQNTIIRYCKECAEANGTEAADCDAVECALWPYRNLT